MNALANVWEKMYRIFQKKLDYRLVNECLAISYADRNINWVLLNQERRPVVCHK